MLATELALFGGITMWCGLLAHWGVQGIVDTMGRWSPGRAVVRCGAAALGITIGWDTAGLLVRVIAEGGAILLPRVMEARSVEPEDIADGAMTLYVGLGAAAATICRMGTARTPPNHLADAVLLLSLVTVAATVHGWKSAVPAAAVSGHMCGFAASGIATRIRRAS